MSDTATTHYSNQCGILAELWLNYRSDEDFQDFTEYNDLGLPLAYAIANDIVKSTEMAQRFIEETFDLLLAGLGIEDTGFETIDDVLGQADK
jgi:hypothetical protein